MMTQITPDTSTIADWSQENILADIEGMIRREGHRQYSNQLAEGVYVAQLCGVIAHLVRKTGMVRLTTHDMDVCINAEGEISYAKGSLILLRAHHRNLCAYRRAMFATLMPASPILTNTDQAA